jgi:hypothetical protein
MDTITFLLKLILVPIFIGAVSLAGRRWGATVSGWLVGLPLSSGPIAFLLALEQGAVFASRASEAIMLGIVSVYLFCLAYSWTALHHGWVESTLLGVMAFFACTFVLDRVTLSLIIELALAVLTLLASLYLMPRVGSDRISALHMRGEIPLRMFSATALVFLITGLAALLGPQLTGLLTPFPIFTITMTVFTHRAQGGDEAVKLLRGVLVGTLTFILFYLIISITIVAWGIAFSFLTAIGASFAMHLTSLQMLKMRSRNLR